MKVCWKVHKLTKILLWNVTKWGLFFNIVSLAIFFYLCCNTWIVLVRFAMKSRYDVFSLPLYTLLTTINKSTYSSSIVFWHPGTNEILLRCQWPLVGNCQVWWAIMWQCSQVMDCFSYAREWWIKKKLYSSCSIHLLSIFILQFH